MKFLTIASTKDTFSTLPEAERNKFNVASAELVLKLKKKMGDKLHFYGVVGWGRAVSIGEYDSFEEYLQTLQSPAAQAGHIKYESYPLIELDVKAAKAWLDSQKAAKKKR